MFKLGILFKDKKDINKWFKQYLLKPPVDKTGVVVESTPPHPIVDFKMSLRPNSAPLDQAFTLPMDTLSKLSELTAKTFMGHGYPSSLGLQMHISKKNEKGRFIPIKTFKLTGKIEDTFWGKFLVFNPETKRLEVNLEQLQLPENELKTTLYHFGHSLERLCHSFNRIYVDAVHPTVLHNQYKNGNMSWFDIELNILNKLKIMVMLTLDTLQTYSQLNDRSLQSDKKDKTINLSDYLTNFDGYRITFQLIVPTTGLIGLNKPKTVKE